MNVLEKILEEISKVEKEYVTGHKALYALGATGKATEISGIIRSHMDDVPDNNDGWIPVSEKLPEVGKMVKVTVHSSEWIADYDSAWVPKEEKTYYPEEYNVYDGYIDRVGMWRFYDEGGSVNACDKEFGINKEIIYDVVTAWMPKEQTEPYKEE